MRVRLIGIMSKMELSIVTRFFIDFNVKFTIDVKEVKIINQDYSDIKVEIIFICNQDVKKFSVSPYDTKTEVNVELEHYGLGFLFKELIHSEIK